jgi:hypothetical protein
MVGTSAIAPIPAKKKIIEIISSMSIIYFPTSLQANLFAMGGITIIPSSSSNIRRCLEVNGCCHMNVFIAGAIITGFVRSHALIMHVCNIMAINIEFI